MAPPAGHRDSACGARPHARLAEHSMSAPFFLRKALTALVLPPTGPLIVALLGLAALRRRPKLGRRLAWFGVLTLLALSLPVVADTLVRVLDESPPLNFAAVGNAGAIVILGGGVRRDAAEYGGDTLSRLSLERVRYGALVARKTHLPVLVSGGQVFGGTPEATLMKQTLEEEFGVGVKWVETASHDTHENAIKSAEILRAADVHSVILVAHSFDMARATAELAAAGLQVTPAPTGIPDDAFDWPDLVPSVGALQVSYYALYELLANAVRYVGIG
jgi:uncharacterized SAM-binding protein YcdF (DUF218 family)